MQEQKLKELYCERRLSMMEVADELNVTHAKVFYWLKKFDIARRSWRDSAYIKQNRQGDPFIIPDRFSSREKELLAAGLLLYWAEGNKGKDAIRIANLDHRMLKVFLNFLREVCKVDDKRLFLYVRVYKEFSLEEARKYWSDFLNIAPQKVSVYPHTDTRSKGNNQRSQHGIATLEFHNTKFKQWLDSSTEDLIQKLLVIPG
ncbi:MAG: hypothetical protein Q7K71_04280 [Candidatus Omnitrophota bacterium]|nr:hypothetical protein [Candidatus Omnitrophota bacterium]